MYNIIGADGKQYGPVAADQIRQWLAENRVRSDTLVQPEGTQEWRPLTAFPELQAGSPSGSSPMPPPVGPSPQNWQERASNKIVAGICGIVLGGLGIHKFILGYTNTGLIMLLVSLLSPFLTCFTFGFLGTAAMSIIGLIEGIIYLTKSDEEFVRTYVDGRKEWF
jgi:TM2 domain-containing membrane protein YozV